MEWERVLFLMYGRSFGTISAFFFFFFVYNIVVTRAMYDTRSFVYLVEKKRDSKEYND